LDKNFDIKKLTTHNYFCMCIFFKFWYNFTIW